MHPGGKLWGKSTKATTDHQIYLSFQYMIIGIQFSLALLGFVSYATS